MPSKLSLLNLVLKKLQQRIPFSFPHSNYRKALSNSVFSHTQRCISVTALCAFSIPSELGHYKISYTAGYGQRFFSFLNSYQKVKELSVIIIFQNGLFFSWITQLWHTDLQPQLMVSVQLYLSTLYCLKLSTEGQLPFRFPSFSSWRLRNRKDTDDICGYTSFKYRGLIRT